MRISMRLRKAPQKNPPTNPAENHPTNPRINLPIKQLRNPRQLLLTEASATASLRLRISPASPPFQCLAALQTKTCPSEFNSWPPRSPTTHASAWHAISKMLRNGTRVAPQASERFFMCACVYLSVGSVAAARRHLFERILEWLTGHAILCDDGGYESSGGNVEGDVRGGNIRRDA